MYCSRYCITGSTILASVRPLNFDDCLQLYCAKQVQDNRPSMAPGYQEVADSWSQPNNPSVTKLK